MLDFADLVRAFANGLHLLLYGALAAYAKCLLNGADFGLLCFGERRSP